MVHRVVRESNRGSSPVGTRLPDHVGRPPALNQGANPPPGWVAPIPHLEASTFPLPAPGAIDADLDSVAELVKP